MASITCLRDGMNLVSYKLVACQSAKPGVLAASELCASATALSPAHANAHVTLMPVLQQALGLPAKS